jgi:tetratricopeptide (TPR) repeat protein
VTARWLCTTGLALGLGCSISLGCSPGQTTVTRIVDSELVRGRYISPEAYASYSRGAYLEAQGDLTRALQAFSEAARRDPENANAWVRRGAVLCALRQRALAEQAFEEAQKLDAESALLWRERARCDVQSGDLPAARRAAERSAAEQPQSIETTLLLVRIYDGLGLRQEANRWLDALVTWQWESPAAWQAAFDHAARRADRQRLLAAAEQLLRLRPERRSALSRVLPEIGLRHTLDQALLEGRLGFSQSAATGAGISAAELAVRAAALGKVNIAREQAELVLAADPRDADAWVALTVSGASFETLRLAEARDLRPPSSLSIRLLASILAQAAGSEAATAWLNAWGPLPEPVDQLELELSSRLPARSSK